jgi:hypothetical protein
MSLLDTDVREPLGNSSAGVLELLIKQYIFVHY